MKSKSPFKACLKKRLSQGHSHDEADALCRHVDPSFNPPPLPGVGIGESSTRRRVQEVGPASSSGPGWRSQGANVGTGAVVYPDGAEAAKAFLKDSGGSKDRVAWEVYAKRLGVSPEDIEKGWQHMSGQDESADDDRAALATLKIIDSMRPKTTQDKAAQATYDTIQRMRPTEVHDPAALATLRKVFGESVKWSGYWVPLKQTIGGNKRENQPKKKPFVDKQPKVTEDSEEGPIDEMDVMGVKTHQAAQDGNAKGQAQILNQDPGFPFQTWSAKQVWKLAQELIPLYPLKKPAEIISLAIQRSGVLATELTPEDDQLIKMAVDYMQNGPPKTNVRTGGNSMGPSGSSGPEDHYMANRRTRGIP